MGNRGWPSGLLTERTRQQLALIGLPKWLLTHPAECKAEGEAIVAELKAIEEQLTQWEATQPIEFLKQLPWYEAREQYKRDKAAGKVEEPTWWEALAFVEAALPSRLTWEDRWGGPLLAAKPWRRRKALEKARLKAAAAAR